MAFAEGAFLDFLVERGEEEVLQDGLVEGGGFAVGQRRPVFEQPGQGGRIEKLAGDQPHLPDEPAENEPGDEADEALGNVGVAVGFGPGHGEDDVIARPEKPVGDLLVELFGDGLDAEGGLELVGDGGEGRGGVGVAVQFLEGEGQQGQAFDGGAGG